MNDKKVAFIYCVNNRQMYEESVRYVRSLHVPEGYEIEIISIEGAKSITSGYNEAMKRTDAKYKVYLHQDVFIVNKNFIFDIIALFDENKQIGIIGTIGAKKIPTSGIWWEAEKKYGKVFDSHSGTLSILAFQDIEHKYETVEAVDGLLMATQYDIRWREDIFDGWHFYDLSHCVEYLKKGYLIVVPKQSIPWCIHDCGIVNIRNGYERYRNLFLDEYSGFLFPLVSILIPTYNRPLLFKEALQSVLAQTYRNTEIIICDDSTNHLTKDVVYQLLETQHSNKRLTYVKNKARLGRTTGLENAQRCLELASGEFVNFLFDDDKFAPNKISRMMNYYHQFNDVCLVTSFRQTINKQGELLPPIKATKKLFNQDTLIDGKVLGKYMLLHMLNVVGEFTTVLFRRNDIEDDLGSYMKKKYYPLSDVSTWLSLLQKGKAVYISEPLSYFRLHPAQNSHDVTNMILGAVEWYRLFKDCQRSEAYFMDSEEVASFLVGWIDEHIHVLEKIRSYTYDREFVCKNSRILNEFFSVFQDAIKALEKHCMVG
ncbi:glycosyltransferase [Geobacillus vulcani]|uniref:glycosyltransferase n=1 Tax=Geobacillus vulcani TaxID=135517 RepID=UPI00068D9745|nr:glycosyltransferase [Geobacillus vulcani]